MRVPLASSACALLLAGATAQLPQHHVYTFHGDQAGDMLGFEGARSAGDVNRDGCPDFVLGAPQVLAGAGYFLVVSGRDGRTLYRFDGDYYGDNLGWATGIGDVDRDGHDDILAGAPQEFT